MSSPASTSRQNLWRHPDFLRLWAGQTVAVFGMLVGQLALQFTAVVFLDATPLQVAALAICQLVPAFVVGLFAGVFVDRWPRKPILVVADLGRFVALATVPLAAMFDVLVVEQLYLVALEVSVLGVFFDVAYRSHLPSLIPRENLVEGNSKLSATESMAEVGGFGIAGWLTQWFTAPGALVVQCFAFLWSAYWIGSIKAVEERAAPAEADASVLRDLRHGLTFVLGHPVLRTIAIANGLLNFGFRMLSVVFLLYLTREVGFSAGVLGMIFAVGGATSLAGAVFADRIGRIGGFGPGLVFALAMVALGALGMPLATSVSIAGVGFLVANQLLTDPFWTIYNINELSLRQAITPPEMLGRMNATIRVVEFGAMLGGGVAGGLIGEFLGLREALFASVGVLSLASVSLLFSPVRRLREAPTYMGVEKHEQSPLKEDTA